MIWACPRPTPNPSPRRVNAPYFPADVTWAETAIFWFGKNEQGVPSQNYTDARVACTAEALHTCSLLATWAICGIF